MHVDRITRLSHRMATVTLWLMCAMLVLNALCWMVPQLGSQQGGYGLSFGLSDTSISSLNIDVATMPWWQKAGAVLLSSIPLLALLAGLRQLRALFCAYGRGEYFSGQSAARLGRTGRAVAWWVLLRVLCEPPLTAWLTFLRPRGEGVVTLSFGSSDIVALFMAASIVVVARILERASDIYAENRQFV